MGLGDEIMATAQVKKLVREQPGKQVVIVDTKRNPRWNDIWKFNPHIVRDARSDASYLMLMSGPGARPYMDRAGRWKEWGIEPGEIYLSPTEQQEAIRLKRAFSDRPTVAIAPHTKNKPNKDWGFNNYQAVVDLLPNVDFIQFRQNIKEQPLNHTAIVDTIQDVRLFATYIWGVDAILCSEGGMHHTAACFNKPGVVIFGGFIHPRYTGYDFQTNIVSSDRICNSWALCHHCREALNSIPPDFVAEELVKILTTLERKV